MPFMAEDPKSFTAPKGTRDILPPESWRWERLTRLALDSFARAGFAPIVTPDFEHTELFERGVGNASEVVTKQMYTFADRGGRSLTLRPEGTAPVMRAILEHGLERGPLPVKLAYAQAMFRYERPQKGRTRQHLQVGAEGIGSENPVLDAEIIELSHRYLRDAGLEPHLLLNSIGHEDASCRQGYIKVLSGFLYEHASELASEDRQRLETNPLRTFDSKEKRTLEVMKGAPLLSEYICDACREHFAEVQGALDDLGVEFEREPRLVRGLDYYTRTTFEYQVGGLGSQSAVGGGGRYDGLSEALGGPRLPGIGFGLGIDRILLALAGKGSSGDAAEGAVDVYVVALGSRAQRAALKLATDLRRAGVGADFDLGGRSMKGQMKDASRSGAKWAVILGEDEMAKGTAALKDLTTTDQRTVRLDEVLSAVRT
ncbi:MAG: histidyl-tRNA synthetase [Actinomycetota bacterium]|nr:histidyl-tRNA synthetase [Actinomycetota bacterium]